MLNKLFHLPGPVELGWSKYEGLQSRELSPDCVGKTWEDWEILMRKKYPISFFIRETLPDFFYPVLRALKNIVYWFKCKLRPKKYNLYKQNLAGVDPLNNSTYGYLDPCEAMRLSAWHALCNYVEKEKPEDPRSYLEKNEVIEFSEQVKAYDEAMLLYNWWKTGQVAEYQKATELFKAREKIKAAGNKELTKKVTDVWLDKHHKFDEKQEEMFLRVCKLRPHLWT